MKSKTTALLSFIYAAVILFAPNLLVADVKTNTVPDVTQGDIIDLAKQSGKFNILLRALEETGLLEQLRQEGPITVFAPTDDAFRRMDSYELNELFKDKEYLKSLLLVHVVDGKIKIKEAVERTELVSREQVPLFVYTNDSGTFVNDAKVIMGDVAAKNGIVHVIDTVLYPFKG